MCDRPQYLRQLLSELAKGNKPVPSTYSSSLKSGEWVNFCVVLLKLLKFQQQSGFRD